MPLNMGGGDVRIKRAAALRIFTWDFLLIFISAGMMRVCYQLQSTLIPLYGNHIGLSATTVGLLITMSTVASLMIRPFLGELLDRGDRRAIALAGTILFGAATLFCGLAGGLAALLLLRTVQGLGFSAHTTAINTLATDTLPASRMSEGIGYMGLTGSVSMAVSPALALLFAGTGQFTPAFVFAGVLGMLSAACLLYVKQTHHSADSTTKDDGTQKHKSYTGWQRFWEKNALKPSIVMLLLGFAYASVSTFFATYALGRGFTLMDVSLYFSLNAIAMAVARLGGGRAAQKIGTRRVLGISFLFSTVGFLMVATAESALSIWTAALLHGLGYGTIYPILNAQAILLSPAHRRGTAMATFLTAMDLGIGLGASIWGVVVDRSGIDSIYCLCAAIALLTYALCCRMHLGGNVV